MINKYFLFIALFFSSFFLFGQGMIVVKGKVISYEKGEPMENVHVKVNQRNIVAKTDKYGDYQISLPKKKNSVLVYS